MEMGRMSWFSMVGGVLAKAGFLKLIGGRAEGALKVRRR
jgi:hypothetical protein